MKRNIGAAFCLAALPLAILTAWMYAKPTARYGETRRDEGNSGSGKAPAEPLDPTKIMPAPPHILALPVQLAHQRHGSIFPCYYDAAFDADKAILYRWRGVILNDKQIPKIYGNVFSGPSLIDADERCYSFHSQDVEAAVHYRQTPEGFRPGYWDRSAWAFYEWKGVILSKEEVPEKSQDGKAAVVEAETIAEVIEIDMPTHLKDHQDYWKKQP